MQEKGYQPYGFGNSLKAEENQRVFETPVRIRQDTGSSAYYNYRTTLSAGFPAFLNKKETVVSENAMSDAFDINMKDSVTNDIMEFTAQFDNAKDKKEKIGICI